MQYSAEQQECTVEDLFNSLCGGDHSSRNHIAVASDVFRCRMHDDVDAGIDRLLKKRRSPAVVDTGKRAMLSSDISHCGKIQGPEHHRAGIFDIHELRIVLHRAFNSSWIDVQSLAVLNAKAAKLLRQLNSRAIRMVHEQDVI